MEVKYTAGFFDADGNVVIEEYKRKNVKFLRGRLQPRVRVTNCHPTVPSGLKKSYGGCVCIMRRRRKNPNHYDCHAWSTVGRKALKFLKDIYPYLIVKKKQVGLAIMFYEDFKNLRHASDEERKKEITRREFIKRRISILNKTHGVG